MRSVKETLLPLYRRWKYIGYFVDRRRPIGFSNEMKMLFNGFFDTSYVLYDLKNNKLNNYVSDFEENVNYKALYESSNLIENKLYFNEIIKPFVLVPETIGLIFKGIYFSNSNASSNFTSDLKERKSVILKEIGGGGGLGIFRVDYNEGKYLLNNKEVNEEELKRLLSTLDEYFVSLIIKQTGYANIIYPRTVNTVRFLTMFSPTLQKPFIAAVSQRIGNDKSFPVDNCAKGGFTAKIDIATGTLGKAVSTKVGKDKKVTWHAVHPDSGSAIEGVVIPGWEELKNKILSLASLFPFHLCVGWDVVIMEHGEMYILEGNDGPDLKLHQVHDPLLAKPEVKAFYKYHKVIK